METITLKYDPHNVQALKALDFMLSLDLFQKEIKPNNNFKNGIYSNRINSIKEALEDVKCGRLTRVHSAKRSLNKKK